MEIGISAPLPDRFAFRVATYTYDGTHWNVTTDTTGATVIKSYDNLEDAGFRYNGDISTLVPGYSFNVNILNTPDRTIRSHNFTITVYQYEPRFANRHGLINNLEVFTIPKGELFDIFHNIGIENFTNETTFLVDDEGHLLIDVVFDRPFSNLEIAEKYGIDLSSFSFNGGLNTLVIDRKNKHNTPSLPPVTNVKGYVLDSENRWVLPSTLITQKDEQIRMYKYIKCQYDRFIENDYVECEPSVLYKFYSEDVAITMPKHIYIRTLSNNYTKVTEYYELISTYVTGEVGIDYRGIVQNTTTLNGMMDGVVKHDTYTVTYNYVAQESETPGVTYITTYDESLITTTYTSDDPGRPIYVKYNNTPYILTRTISQPLRVLGNDGEWHEQSDINQRWNVFE